LLLVVGIVVTAGTAMAQDAAAPAARAPAAPAYNESQLEQMVAPIALYPDALVSQILIGATYPIQVVEAYQWLQRNKSLSGTRAQEAAKSQGWDPSVQSLVQFPQIIERMYKNLDWTQNLGEAFLAQQQQVMSTIQAMRQKAYAAGNLKSTEKQNVVVQQDQTIVIVPAQPQVVYVPTYNPMVVYGTVWAPSVWYYPPAVYAPWPGYNPAAGAIAFGAGVAVGAAWSSASYCSWSSGSVTVNNNYYYNRSYHGSTTNSGQAGSIHGENGTVAHAGNTTAAYNANTGEVKSYNSATGETRSGQVTQGERGTAVQGENGSVAHAGNTTASYNKNTGEAHTYNSATGQTRSGNTNDAGTSSWQHDSAQRQGQPYGNQSLNRQYGGTQNSAAARGYGGEGGGSARASESGGGGGFAGGGFGGGRFEGAASDRGWASRGGGGGYGGGGGFRGGGRR